MTVSVLRLEGCGGIIQRAHIPISIQGNVFKIIARGC